jgi:gamma-glutamylcyclotransferase (GGCT)/AIG2-like uncharacterized protein YtfP
MLDSAPRQEEIEDALARPWRIVQGELALLPGEESLVRELDRFEGFDGRRPEYLRALAGVFLENRSVAPAWLYHLNKRGSSRPLRYLPHSRWKESVAALH